MGSYVENPTKKGWLTSILELGAWTGTIYAGFMAEMISRKYAILVNTAIFIVGVVVQACSAAGGGSSAILGGRFITGTHLLVVQINVPTILTLYRYGSRIPEHDRPHVQRRVRAA